MQIPLTLVQLTPPGRGAVATLRIEGPGALQAIRWLFHKSSRLSLGCDAPHRMAFGHFGGPSGEEVVVRVLSNASVDLHCHGGHAAVERIRNLLSGLQEATVPATTQANLQETCPSQPGDSPFFETSRCRTIPWQAWVGEQSADPIVAAAWIALAEVRTQRCAAILLDQYQGVLRRALGEIERALVQGSVARAVGQIERLRSRAALGQHLTEPWRIVLAGPPNAGKSSLLNALLGYPRAIVHPSPGTTRDALTAVAALEGWPVELCDTAGIRPGEDPLELAGIELARERLASADLILLIFDSSRPWTELDQRLAEFHPAALLVHNKSDLPPATHTTPRPPGVAISALTKQGLDRLAEVLVERLVPAPPDPGEAVPFTARQAGQLQRVLTTIRNGDLRRALEELRSFA